MPPNAQKALQVAQTMMDTPLPALVERLGLSIAQAQAALDRNALDVAAEMAQLKVELGGTEYSMLELGFTPSFYAFTEATIEAKVAFTVAQNEELGVDVGVGVQAPIGPVLLAANVNVHYSRKYSFQVEGSSSVAARLVSLPGPQAFQDKLREAYGPGGTATTNTTPTTPQ